jgi:hypothetical protein
MWRERLDADVAQQRGDRIAVAFDQADDREGDPRFGRGLGEATEHDLGPAEGEVVDDRQDMERGSHEVARARAADGLRA